ncbi:hypothetical protein JB92DRAFT_3125312 [Gautieria morchelliformis]|nr:hypothetical protein JB92DRAFT_3125312 [Gautieria morchelliformis]
MGADIRYRGTSRTHPQGSSQLGESTTGLTQSMNDILSSYTIQAAAIGSSRQSEKRKRLIEDQARDEAISGFKRAKDRDSEPTGNKKVTRKGKKPQKQLTDSLRLVTLIPEGLDADGNLNDDSEPSLQRVEQLVKLGFARYGAQAGDLESGSNWSTRKLDEWLRMILPIAFDHLDTQMDADDPEAYTWRLCKANRSHLELHRELPDGIDFKDAKGGKSKGWQDSKLYIVSQVPLEETLQLLGNDGRRKGSTSKGKGKRKQQASDSDSDPETRYYTRSKKRQKLSVPESSISSKATASADDKYDIEWPETFDADAAFPSLAAPMSAAGADTNIYIISSDSEPGSPAKLPTPSEPRLSLANLEESCDASMKKMDELYSGFGALRHISQTPWSFITPQAVPLEFLPPAAPPAPLAPPALPVPPGLPTLPVALAPPTLATDAVLPALPA